MKSTIFTAPLLAIAAAVAMPAVAVPVFQVTPSVLGGTGSPFNASKISGNASALLTLNAATQTVTGTGWVGFTSFSNNGNGVAGSGLFDKYELWTEFTYTTKLSSGTFGANNSVYDVVQLNFTVYGKQVVGGAYNFYQNAEVLPATVMPSVALGAGGTLQTIGTGSLDTALPFLNSASISGSGGTQFNANSLFSLTNFGKTFFTQPDPFYTNAFNSFTNTSSGFTRSADQTLIALTQADGGIDFAGAVPEPTTLALVGLALLGLGATARRRNS